MSRRRLQWKKRIVQSGMNVDKLIPGDVKGAGEWLTQTHIESKATNPERGHGEGSQVSVGMGARKEQLVRKWAGSLK